MLVNQDTPGGGPAWLYDLGNEIITLENIAPPEGVKAWGAPGSLGGERLFFACRMANRNMTSGEWENFGPAGLDYRETCDLGIK